MACGWSFLKAVSAGRRQVSKVSVTATLFPRTNPFTRCLERGLPARNAAGAPASSPQWCRSAGFQPAVRCLAKRRARTPAVRPADERGGARRLPMMTVPGGPSGYGRCSCRARHSLRFGRRRKEQNRNFFLPRTARSGSLDRHFPERPVHGPVCRPPRFLRRRLRGPKTLRVRMQDSLLFPVLRLDCAGRDCSSCCGTALSCIAQHDRAESFPVKIPVTRELFAGVDSSAAGRRANSGTGWKSPCPAFGHTSRGRPAARAVRP